MKSTSTTNITRLTPVGRGAVAVLLIDGVDAIQFVERRFISAGKIDWKTASLTAPVFGRFRIGNSNAYEEIVLFRPSENQFEIQSHGGEIVVAAIEKSFVESGAVSVTQIQYVSEHEEILAMLPRAKTERIAKIVLDQLHADFDAVIKNLCSLLSNSDPKIQADGVKRLNRLHENAKLGCRLFDSFRVVLTGSVNAGKSSLLNAIVGFDRVIVDTTAGTTRDAVGIDAVLDGWPIALIDTAGIRETNDPLERMGIVKATEVLESADIVLKVVDLSSEPHSTPQSQPENMLTVLNKCDLTDSYDSGNTTPSIRVSATENTGIAELCEMIVKMLVANPPAIGEIVPLIPRQIAEIAQIKIQRVQ